MANLITLLAVVHTVVTAAFFFMIVIASDPIGYLFGGLVSICLATFCWIIQVKISAKWHDIKERLSDI